jgi:hypothetical protein
MASAAMPRAGRSRRRHAQNLPAMNTLVETSAAAYLAKMQPAVAGNDGSGATFAAACRLVEFGLSFEQAEPVLAAWNETHCEPRWTAAELKHKLADAFKRTNPKPEFAKRRSGFHSYIGNPQKPCVRPPATQSKRATADFSDSFFDPSPAGRQFSALASLRGISIAGVRLAYERNLLRFGRQHGRAAWFILDGSRRVAQARRMDGQPWPEIGDKKAWTLRGSQAVWPAGVEESAPFATVAVCEGSPDLLAAHHFIWTENRAQDCAAVAIFGGANIHADALRYFANKRVRIFRHLDAAGDAAMNRWAKQIADAGAVVDAFNFGGLRQSDGRPVEDLNDCARIHADDFLTHRCLWNLLP